MPLGFGTCLSVDHRGIPTHRDVADVWSRLALEEDRASVGRLGGKGREKAAQLVVHMLDGLDLAGRCDLDAGRCCQLKAKKSRAE